MTQRRLSSHSWRCLWPLNLDGKCTTISVKERDVGELCTIDVCQLPIKYWKYKYMKSQQLCNLLLWQLNEQVLDTHSSFEYQRVKIEQFTKYQNNLHYPS